MIGAAEALALRLQVWYMGHLERRMEPYAPPEDDDCGGWGWDPPCGGCNRCFWLQVAHAYQDKTSLERWRRIVRGTLAVALVLVGLVVAFFVASVIVIIWVWP